MPASLVNANAVIVAHHFNPTIMDQIWLAENGIVNRDEPVGSFAFTDMLVQVQAHDYHLLIVPDRCQLTPSPEYAQQQDLVVDRLCRLVETLPHTPYQAAGLNFNWHFRPANDQIVDFVRRRFFVQDSPLHQRFNRESARFGGYLSTDFLDCRFRLDVKPITIKNEEQRIELMQFAFNFNLDFTEDHNVVADIRRILGHWNEVKQETNDIVNASIEGFE